MRQHVGAKLSKFILFNDEWGAKEGSEQEKVIFYHLWDSVVSGNESSCGSSLLVDLEESSISSSLSFELSDAAFSHVLKDVGFAEAMIQFVNNFGDEHLSAVHGCKVRLVFEQVEPHYWMCCVLQVPRTVSSSPENGADSNQLIEYHEHELNDHHIRLILRQVHDTFCLFNGSFTNLWTACDRSLAAFRARCAQSLHWFVNTIQLFSINLMHLLGAISYLPLDKILFLEAQCLVQQVLFVHPRCRHALLLYNDQIVYSSMPLHSTAQLYRYLVSIVLPEVTSQEMSETFRSRNAARTCFVKSTEPVHLSLDPDDDLDSSAGRTLKVCLMSIYRANNGGTVVLLLEPTESQANDARNAPSNGSTSKSLVEDAQLQHILDRLHAQMALKLPEISAKLGEQSVRLSVSLEPTSNSAPTHLNAESASDQLKYAYFNANNLAYKSNCGLNGQFDHRKLIECEFVHLILDIEHDLRTQMHLPDNLIELVAKSTNDCWLIVNESDARTLYTFLNNKNANLVEAYESSQTNMSKRLKNILFV
jgi:hypothetical protein